MHEKLNHAAWFRNIWLTCISDWYAFQIGMHYIIFKIFAIFCFPLGFFYRIETLSDVRANIVVSVIYVLHFLFSVSLWRRANARNVRPYYPYWQYTDLFIFRFMYFVCLAYFYYNYDVFCNILHGTLPHAEVD